MCFDLSVIVGYLDEKRRWIYLFIRVSSSKNLGFRSSLGTTEEKGNFSVSQLVVRDNRNGGFIYFRLLEEG